MLNLKYIQNKAVGGSENPWASSNVVGIICPSAEYNFPKSGNPPRPPLVPTDLHLLKKISFSATQSDEIISEEKLSTCLERSFVFRIFLDSDIYLFKLEIRIY